MNLKLKIIATIALIFSNCLLSFAQKKDSYFDTQSKIDYQNLKEGFHNIPQHAKMRAWWFWMNGIATKESITQDLEAMKENGIGGALVCDNGGDYAPSGVVFMSDKWKENFAHVIKEADRLGIEISLNIQSGAGDPGNPNIADDNGLKEVTSSEIVVKGGKEINIKLPMPPNKVYYKDIAVQAIKTVNTEKQKDDLIKNWSVKSFFRKEHFSKELDRYDMNQFYDTYNDDGTAHALKKGEIIDLSENYKNGKLTWDAPKGDWTIVRYGMTSTGRRNNYASAGYKGGLCYDPIHKRGINAQWKDVVQPLIDVAKENGNSLKYIHVDSWEMGTTNWTHNFTEEFKKRRGYDITPYLPVLTGRIVENREITNRFLEDFRMTVGDLVADEQYREMHRLAHSQGISMHSENAGPHLPPVDGLKVMGINDIPMGESWARSTTHRTTEGKRINIKLGASAAHIYGKRFFAAETPTTVGPVWERSPADVKNVLDRGFCTGVNRVNWHTYTSSPDEHGLPGIEYFAGTHLNRNITWWKESKSFINYINRVQHMLVQGIHVADVLGYTSSGLPLFGFLDDDRKDIPSGYAWDMCNADVILNRASVKNGRIYLPDGKNYSILALPEFKDMSLPVLKKIEQMVKDGITLVGDKPERSTGLTGYPRADKELEKIINRLWGEADGKTVFLNKYGKGKVYIGKDVAQVLDLENIKPDLAWDSKSDIDLEYIHHTSEDVDVYYVINKWLWNGLNELEYFHKREQPDRYINTSCTFRVSGDRKIERWDPVSGKITPVKLYEYKDGCYTLPVSLEPEGGAFYVFTKAKKDNNITAITKNGKPVSTGNTPLEVGASKAFVRDNKLEVLETGKYDLKYQNGKEVKINHTETKEPISITGNWEVRFKEKPLLGNPFTEEFDELISWTESEKREVKYFSGTAIYSKKFNFDGRAVSEGKAYLNLGRVGDVATVRINGKEVGVYWKAPYIADITDYLVEGENALEVSVTNLWINRLVGDEKLPNDERKTNTNLRNIKGGYSFERFAKPDADKYLRYSGLMGPVKIQYSRIYEIK